MKLAWPCRHARMSPSALAYRCVVETVNVGNRWFDVVDGCAERLERSAFVIPHPLLSSDRIGRLIACFHLERANGGQTRS